MNHKKALGFIEPFVFKGFSSGRYAVHIINIQSSQNQVVTAVSANFSAS